MEVSLYIKDVNIQNIRSISSFRMKFPENPAGWHVLIGDNGSGKSSIIRSISLGLIGPDQALGIRPNWNEWLREGEFKGGIQLIVNANTGSERLENTHNRIIFRRSGNNVEIDKDKQPIDLGPELFWSSKSLFSAGFGPFRRFTGGLKEYESIFNSPTLIRLSSHLTLFGEDVALTEATAWLVQLQYRFLEKAVPAETIELIKAFINSPDFLPNGVQLKEISSQGVFFQDANGSIINVNQMSDGFRSILSLTFELIRQMVALYGFDVVFKNIMQGNRYIGISGVVLIDEVDAHLHPTWQTRIGQWFLEYFPNIQFIVTTHSPLICRACEKGSIWRLAAPGSDQQPGEVTGIDRQRLIYGNILDAYGTEVFGENVEISKEANEKKMNWLS